MAAKTGLLCILLAASVGQPALADDPTKAVERTLEAYEQAWSHHDAGEVASFYYEPAMRVSATGPVVRATRQDQETFFNTFLPTLVKSGYDRSRWESLEIRLLDSTTALASGVTVRYRSNGSVFGRVGVTYALYRTPQGWKIFLSATHEAGTALRFR